MAGAVTQEGGDRLANFGQDDGDFITFHLDSDFQVDTIHFGKQTADWLQGPIWWVTGDGKDEPTKTTEDWQVRSKKK
jgi:hypothetical protein